MARRTVLLVDDPAAWRSRIPDHELVAVREYLTGTAWREARELKVVNLSRYTGYLGTGYYASLLAEARDHRVMPSARTLQDLSRPSLYGPEIDEVGRDLDRHMGRVEGAAERDRLDWWVFFGVSTMPPLQPVARILFERFRAPVLHVTARRREAGSPAWRVEAIRAVGLAGIPEDERPAFLEALAGQLGRPWRRPRERRSARYDMAILHDPEEALPPSNRAALAHFIRAARRLGIDAQLVTRGELAWLAEYDALFIRETTSVADHTYRFSRRAAAAGLVVMDDPDSIVRCTNKIYLAELLERKRIPGPRSLVVDREDLEEAGEVLGFPLILKIPDGSFSRGVFKVQDRVELAARGREMFERSQLLLAQAYTFTPFDWRIGVLAGEPLFACRYHMSPGHWQILDHGRPGDPGEGDTDTLAVEAVPAPVVETAVRAARAVGDGLYGVDLKETEDQVLVIEVNDNPNLDAGVEDGVLGPALYERIMAEFLRRLEARTARRGGTGDSPAGSQA